MDVKDAHNTLLGLVVKHIKVKCKHRNLLMIREFDGLF